ncbi:MAG: hypothetical protein ACI9LM_002489 [Alteromonadaceae bacterium]|jgi:hypothetical protein
MKPFLLQKLIKDATQGEFLDIKMLAKELEVTIALVKEKDMKNLCEISCDNKEEKALLKLNKTLDKKSRFTFVAIALAEYILTPERVEKTGINYDIFFLSDIYKQRYGYRMLLATRLAVPEHMIEKLCNHDPGADEYIIESDYLPQFLRCCVSNSSALFLLSNFSELSDV